MKKRSFIRWHTWMEQLDTYAAATLLKWKKRLNPLTNKLGFGIYFYKDITVNLNRLNKDMLVIAADYVKFSHVNTRTFPSFISVADGINATMFSQVPNHVIKRIITLVTALPGYKALQSASRSYGYKCELHYNQGKAFFGSLQIHFQKMQNDDMGTAYGAV
ncbi:hypothetical protein GCM10008018_26570 [Paenibacillus marchantiophytorum]|uniref:Uncharacterized protein n=1 Tax=Paenibacillus marchantiophytorum TaxID=1619310 RepID=A0ABQ1ENE1_9BACL|nr:hypothetical protein [Paenibacillus marchantiophytorum]GFZ79702.1 hypothetical protein GCM10008018_26570 [Paenibacillus marchantiophytorum]